MALSKRQISNLKKIIATAQKILATEQSEDTRGAGDGVIRRRRSRVEASKMRAEILTQREKGVPATQLARKYGVSTAYVYMIKNIGD
ncbi:hypothetical protein [Aestuariivirga sp.]|uniref:hypothetical protein n=1 Tax=Aestuariivirga sp. TaxID=2650926 RepID=UPI00391BB4F6